MLRLNVRGLSGEVQTLEFIGISSAEAARRAAAQGFTVLTLETENAANADEYSQKAAFPLFLFNQELLALLDAGLNLTEALTTLRAKERVASVRAALQQILRAIHEGRSFSDVLSEQPGHFPPVYVATVRASERTGNLPDALSRYIAYQIQFETLRKKLTSAIIYPALLLIVGGLVALFLLGYVVPRFSSVYDSTGHDIPWLSSVLLAFGSIIHAYWKSILPIFLALIVLSGFAIRQRAVQLWLTDQLLRLPFLSKRLDEFRLARFYRGMSLLLSAGIAMPNAMEMVGNLLGDKQQSRLLQSRAAVEAGQSLSNALGINGLTTPVSESLIKVGERSGQMAQMLERAANFADGEFSRWIDWIMRLLEPVLMIIIGIVIGTVVVLMYMPIFELVGGLQ